MGSTIPSTFRRFCKRKSNEEQAGHARAQKVQSASFFTFFGRTTRGLGSNGEFRALPEVVVLRKLTDEAIRLIFGLVPMLDSIKQEPQFGTHMASTGTISYQIMFVLPLSHTNNC